MPVLTTMIHKEEYMYLVECPEVKKVSQGFTIQEVVANLKDTIELYLEEFFSKERSFVTTFEVAQVARAQEGFRKGNMDLDPEKQ